MPRLLIAIVCLTGAFYHASAAPFDGSPTAGDHAFQLVKAGQPAASIVIAEDALPSNRFAAEELQHYVKAISGATLPIATDAQLPEGPVIAIGASSLTANLQLDIPAGFTRQLDEEGFVIRTTGDLLVLCGNDGGPRQARSNHLGFENTYKGSLFAVYELLERLGCRWYMPGAYGEVVPTSADVSIPALDIRQRPSFPVRGFWYGLPPELRKDEAFQHDMQVWMMRNRYLPYGSVLASAGDGSIMGPFRKIRVEKTPDGERKRINTIFEEHPEYFALRADGSHNEHYLCLSHPEVLRIAAEHVLQFFRDNPQANCYGYAPPDGAPTCECPDCRAANYGFMQKPPSNIRIQDISDGFYRFLNQVAAEVEKEFPEKWITTTAYSGRIRPPEGITLHPNISVHTAYLGHSRHHRYDFSSWQTQERVQLNKRWGEISPFSVERPYFPPLQFHCHVPLPMYRAHAFNIRLLHAQQMAGSEWEQRCAFMSDGLNLYVRAKLLWDIETDVDALLDDFYTNFYGAAAEPARAFFEAVETQLTMAPVDHHEEERITDIYPHAFVVRVTDAVGNIEALVADADDATRLRVRLLRLIVDHFRAYSEMRHAETELDFATAAAKAETMIELEGQIQAIHPSLVDGGAERRDSSPFYGLLGANASPHGKLKQYRAKQALFDGTTGDLVTALPVTWSFTTDSRDEGVVWQWYLDGDHGQRWHDLATTQCWEMQGFQDEKLYGYNGFAWYRTRFTVPEQFRGRRIILFIGGLNEQGWFWVNGRLAGVQPFHEYWRRWEYHHEIDVTDFVEFGKENTLAVRVFNEQNFGGIFRRSFLYTPKPQ